MSFSNGYMNPNKKRTIRHKKWRTNRSTVKLHKGKHSRKIHRQTSRRQHPHLLKGGQFLGAGTFGAVYSPNLPCDTDHIDSGSSKFVSKIVYDPSDCEQEYSPAVILSEVFTEAQLRRFSGYAAVPLKKCDVHPDATRHNRYDDEWLKDSRGRFGPIDISDTNKWMIRGREIPGSICQVLYKRGKIDFHTAISQTTNLVELTEYMDSLLSVAKGIQMLQEKDLVHLDIKPANVVLFKEALAGGEFLVPKLIDLGDLRKISSIGREEYYKYFINAMYPYYPPSTAWLTLAIHREVTAYDVYSQLKQILMLRENQKRIPLFWTQIAAGLYKLYAALNAVPSFSPIAMLIESIARRYIYERTFGAFDRVSFPDTETATPVYLTREEIATRIRNYVRPIRLRNPRGRRTHKYTPFVSMMTARYMNPLDEPLLADGSRPATPTDLSANERVKRILKHIDVYQFGILLLSVIAFSRIADYRPLLTPENFPHIQGMMCYIELAASCIFETEKPTTMEDILCQFTQISFELNELTTAGGVGQSAKLQPLYFWKLFWPSADGLFPTADVRLIDRRAYRFYLTEMMVRLHQGICDVQAALKEDNSAKRVENIKAYVLEKHAEVYKRALWQGNDLEGLDNTLKTMLEHNIEHLYSDEGRWWGR